MESNTALPPDFDAWSQPIQLLQQDGSKLVVSMEDFNFYRLYGVRIGINYGTQIGASMLLLLVLLLLTKSSKRRSSLFVMNALCLVCNIIYRILTSCFLTSTMWHPYTQLSQDQSRVATSDLATIVASNTMHLIVSMLVMISLSLQVWVVCVTTKPSQRFVIMGVTSMMALISVGFKFAVVVISNEAALNFVGVDEQHTIVTGSYVTQAVAIWLYSCVFTWKLGYAIIQRRRLNMPQFGPLQIIFIMGCQTMIIPALFSVMQFSADITEKLPEVGTQVLTVVCIFLPLSAIWAGVVNESSIAHRGRDAHQRLIHSNFNRDQSSKVTSDSTTAINMSSHSSACTDPKSGDIECSRLGSSAKQGQMADDSIYVDREFCVRMENSPSQV